MTRVLITGGAGFIGSTLALELAARHRDWDIVAFDNLRRRGSELNVRACVTLACSFTTAMYVSPQTCRRVGRSRP